MIVLTADSASALFTAACQAVLLNGRVACPRDLTTTEVVGAHLRLTNPRRRLVAVPPARVINPAFAVAEALWILSGSDSPWIYDYNDKLRVYADDGVLCGAYGPRLRRWDGHVDQLDAVRRQLLNDRESRRGVIQLFDPSRDHRGYRDVPCTLGYRFFVRDGRLIMHTSMRSQDLWLGFPYDIFTTTLIHELMAGWLDVELGEYHHHVDSLHLYAHNAEAAAASLHGAEGNAELAPVDAPWPDLDHLLQRVLDGDTSLADGSTWDAFGRSLASYRAWKAGERDHARKLATDTPDPLGAALVSWYDHLAPAKPAGQR
ncbi:thymidylate synthase [Micromonospora rifamycinica]|uniref:Thymidylate synthase n=1 Tax=Micromonospora rifamycinica TaxID=291594 RepID=A0A120F946_9ACTN|nr:thymidylate synthase [Micromonospora rifamycinica]KWV32842.1 methyltransferase [Micromonospora rifamycinica]SCG57182.1 thymidylate synthase [Micromonospora rifamycinica]